MLGEVLFCEVERRVRRGIQCELWWMLFCELHGRVLVGMQSGVLVEVLFCEIDGQVLGMGHAVLRFMAGCYRRSGWQGRAGWRV